MSLSPEDQFLMGGGGAPSAFTKHDGIGTRKGGRVTERPKLAPQTDFKTGEPLTWPDGNPREQLVVTVQTELRDPTNPDDDGNRRFYIKGNLQRAVRDAVQAAGGKGLEVGGSLFVTRTGQDAPKQRGEDGAWLYSAEYTPAASNFIAPEQTAPVQAVQQQVPAAQSAAVSELETLLAQLPAEQATAMRQVPGLNAVTLRAMLPHAFQQAG